MQESIKVRPVRKSQAVKDKVIAAHTHRLVSGVCQDHGPHCQYAARQLAMISCGSTEQGGE
jgi:hypothetical protein